MNGLRLLQMGGVACVADSRRKDTPQITPSQFNAEHKFNAVSVSMQVDIGTIKLVMSLLSLSPVRVDAETDEQSWDGAKGNGARSGRFSFRSSNDCVKVIDIYLLSALERPGSRTAPLSRVAQSISSWHQAFRIRGNRRPIYSHHTKQTLIDGNARELCP